MHSRVPGNALAIKNAPSFRKAGNLNTIGSARAYGKRVLLSRPVARRPSSFSFIFGHKVSSVFYTSAKSPVLQPARTSDFSGTSSLLPIYTSDKINRHSLLAGRDLGMESINFVIFAPLRKPVPQPCRRAIARFTALIVPTNSQAGNELGARLFDRLAALFALPS